MGLSKPIVIIGICGIASEILYRLYIDYIKESSEKKTRRFIFFPDKGILDGNFAHNMNNSSKSAFVESLYLNDLLINNTVATMCSKSILANSTSLIHLIDIIDSAQQTLVVCVMVITCTHLADAIIRAKKRGVSVRIVVDSTMVETKGSQLPRLRQYNILTCSMSCPGGLMHNKFAVVDAFESNSDPSIKLAKSSRGTAMSGSFNWTWTGVICNEENVYISSDVDFVNPLADRFEKIWKKLIM